MPHPPPAAHFPLPMIHCSMQASHHPVPNTVTTTNFTMRHCPGYTLVTATTISIVHCPLFTAIFLLPVTHCLLSTTHCPPPITTHPLSTYHNPWFYHFHCCCLLSRLMSFLLSVALCHSHHHCTLPTTSLTHSHSYCSVIS